MRASPKSEFVAGPDRTLQASPERPNAIPAGHHACPGCGEVLGARFVLDAAMKAAGGRLVIVTAPGCLETFGAVQPSWFRAPSGRLAALAAELAADAKHRDARVVAQAGDRATSNMGFAPLMRLFERNDDVFYVCYDNEGAMSTPNAVPQPRKDLPRLAVEGAIPYAATASIADLADLERKVTRAIGLRGARYLHVHTPCPAGWGAAPHDTIRLARLAMECGLFPVFEAERGKIMGRRHIRHRIPVAEYLKPQRRYAALDQGEAGRLQAIADANILDLLEGDSR